MGPGQGDVDQNDHPVSGSAADRLARAATVLARAEAEAGLSHSSAGKEPDPVVPPVPLAVERERLDADTDSDAESVARAIVMRQLAMTARSRGQLETKLRQRGCDDAVAAKVLDRMTEIGLVDDEAYAGMFVREKHSVKGLARGALAHELRKQGVDPELAGAALGQVEAADERLRAEQLATKKLRAMGGLAPDVQARRLGAMLARKGYPGEIAWPVVRDAIAGAPEHQRD